METETMATIEESEVELTDNNPELNDHISIRRIDSRNVHYLNLDRCLKQSFSSLNENYHQDIVKSISISHNYLIQTPSFLANYTNLIELNASHNELSNAEFILYQISDEERIKQMNYGETTNHKILKNQTPRPLVHPFLENINLSYNHIKSIPIDIHYLRFLHTLDLSHNYLDQLPANLGHLEQLHTLILDHNYLKDLPYTFTSLNKLRILNLSYNQFESVDIIKDFEYLKSIFLDSNPLKTFPSLLYTCFNLERISLSNIQLNQMDTITIEYFKQFSKLKVLDLSENNLNNLFLSSTLIQFEHLEEFYIQNNHLTNLKSLLSTMKSLYLLDMSRNLLNRIPEIQNTKLKILRLSHNNIDINPNDCIYLKSIVELDLDHNEISRLPNEFSQCFNLRSLNISYNQFKKFPDIIFHLTSLNRLIFNNSNILQLSSSNSLFKKHFSRTLNVLDLSNNNLHTNLSPLTLLKEMTHLDLSSNNLNELDQDFKFLTCLQVLKLGKNKFTQFPTWLYEISTDRDVKYLAETLRELYINDNNLKSIPEEINQMKSLETIDLSNNQFGKFPDSLICLEQLSTLIYSQRFGVHINKLPDDFVELSKMKVLDLSHNTFHELPSSIYNLSKLEYLNMSDNLLTGIEFNRLSQLKHLKTVKLNGNNFTSFPFETYKYEVFHINDNKSCLAPPNDLINDEYRFATSNLFVQINDQYEDKLFEIYKKIFIENLTSYDIEPLLIRLKLSDDDKSHFRTTCSNLKRQERIEILLNTWKEKRNSLANPDALYRIAQLIGDKKLVQRMRKACLVGRKMKI